MDESVGDTRTISKDKKSAREEQNLKLLSKLKKQLKMQNVDEAETSDAVIDVCRYCRGEATPEQPLFHPCLCTGSIKFVHNDCLTQWLKHSKKEFCELCDHKFTFKPVYRPDMPKNLPVHEYLFGFVSTATNDVKRWFSVVLVAVTWLIIVPETASFVHKWMFRAPVALLRDLPLNDAQNENLETSVYDYFIIILSLFAYQFFFWLKKRVTRFAAPNWLDFDVDATQNVPPEDNNDPEGDNNFLDLIVQFLQLNQFEDFAQRYLGLYNFYILVKNVFLVLSLVIIFTVDFVLLPYLVGYFTLESLNLSGYVELIQLELLTTTLVGYFAAAIVFYALYLTCRLTKFKKAFRITGMAYLMLKVFLLLVLQTLFFPLFCGCWLDVCSLHLFSTSLTQRVEIYRSEPLMSLIYHWLTGIIYIFYVHGFVSLIRKNVRDGVLWFLPKNFDDNPDYQPIKRAVQLPVHHYVRRFLMLLVIFGFTVVVVVYCPIRILSKWTNSILPYNIRSSAVSTGGGVVHSTLFNRGNNTVGLTDYFDLFEETLFDESSIKLMDYWMKIFFLYVLLPTLIQQSYVKRVMNIVVKYWCVGVSRLLGLSEYLLPYYMLPGFQHVNNVKPTNNAAQNNDQQIVDQPAGQEPVQAEQANPPPPAAAVENQQPMWVGGNADGANFQKYTKPSWFLLKIVILLLCFLVSVMFIAATFFTIPVLIGRRVIFLFTGYTQVYELYTFSCGWYVCSAVLYSSFRLVEHAKRGLAAILVKLRHLFVLLFVKVSKLLLVAFPLVFVIPTLLGVLFRLALTDLVYTTQQQSSLNTLRQDWGVGIMFSETLFFFIRLGPDSRLKRVFSRIFENGLHGLNVRYVYDELIIPTVTCIGLIIAVPYVIVHSLYDVTLDQQILFQHYVYPGLMMLIIVVTCVFWNIRGWKSFLLRIRNRK